MHSFRSIIETTEKLIKNYNLLIFPGVGAFEQLFGLLRGEFEQKFSKNSNARGVARGGRGMLKLQFGWYINTKKQTSWGLKKFTQWLEKRKISCDIHTMSPAELNKMLPKFFAAAKANKKTDPTPSALTGILYEPLFTAQLQDNLFQGR